MGMVRNIFKAIGLVDRDDALTPEQKKKKIEDSRKSLQEKADKLKDAPLNRFQREAEKLKLNK